MAIPPRYALPIVAPLLAVFCAAAHAQGPVALINADFEQPDPQRAGMPLAWGHYPGTPTGELKFVWDDQQARSGKRSVCIVVGDRNASWLPSATEAYATSLDAEDIARPGPPAVVGHEYTLSVWVRAEGSARQSATLVLRWTNEDGWVPSYVREHFQLDGDDWQLLAISATAPEGSKWAVPILQVGSGQAPGRIWYDDVALVDRTGIACEVRTPPALCGLPARWGCEVAATGSQQQPLPLKLTVTPGVPGAAVEEAQGNVAKGEELRVRAEYDATGPHHVRYVVTSAETASEVYAYGEIEAPPALKADIRSPLYRGTIYGNSAGRQARIRTRIAAAEGLRAQFHLDVRLRVGEKTVAEAAVAKPGPDELVVLELPELPAGTHTFELELRAGQQSIGRAELPLHCRPGVTPAVAIGDRNELLIDGKPTFPLGFYSTLPQDFKRFASEGFNTVLTYTSNAESCAAMAQQAGDAGLKLIVSALRPYVAERNADGIRAAVNEVLVTGAPGLMGYYLWDEPSPGRPGQEPEDMRWLYEQAMEADPSHLTCTVFCQPGHFKPYADTMDVFMVDPYPTHHGVEPDLTRVADWVDRAREAVDDRKPVWVVPQAFDHLIGPGTYRMPTVEEQRCMTYLGLVHGAKGVIWFVYTGFCIHSDEIAKQRGLPPGQAAWAYRGTIPACFPLRWEGFKQIVREVNELSPVLLSEDPEQAQRVTEGADAIHCLLKAAGRERYLFAVNAKNRDAQFACELPAADDAAEVLWEGRTVKLRNGAIEDKFAPYEVHVYRLTGGN